MLDQGHVCRAEPGPHHLRHPLPAPQLGGSTEKLIALGSTEFAAEEGTFWNLGI